MANRTSGPPTSQPRQNDIFRGEVTSVKEGRHGAWRRRACLCVTATTFVAGCASTGPRPEFSRPVRDIKGVDCPEERIEVVETSERGSDIVYRLDACGTNVEIARGLAVPSKKSEINAENPTDPPPDMQPSVPGSATFVVREKVQAWCVRTSEPKVDPEAISFPVETDAKLAECRTRLADQLQPIGTHRDKESGLETYWFALGEYRFTVYEAVYEPSDTRAIRRRPLDENPADVEARQARRERIGRPWFGRFEFGGGYAHHQSQSGGSVDVRSELGAKITPDLGLGLFGGLHWAFARRLDDTTRTWDLGFVLPYYPVSGSGLRVDVSGGVAFLNHHPEDAESGFSDAGPVAGAGIGYDIGARKQRTPGNDWTGFALTLRGFYTFSEHPLSAVILDAGLYAW
jgi:hypothetical protein